MSQSFAPSFAILYAASPAALAPVTVKSGMHEMLACVMPWPQPRTYAGAFFNDFARSALVITIAPPPSVTRQQSRTVNGYEIMRDLSTSATVRFFFSHATGLSCAHFRAATATSANCSRVVPNSCIWRDAASAYALVGMNGLNGVSYGLISRAEDCRRPTLRCVEP